jgi:LEA14-like dessication related protein
MVPSFRLQNLKTSRGFLLAVLAWVTGCSLLAPKYQRPEVTVAGIELKGGNLLQQNFLVKFDVHNPNTRDLPVTSLRAELNVAGERVASGMTNNAFVVPAQSTTQFDMTITANLGLALLKLSQRPEGASSAIEYEMTGSASIDLPFLRDLPFRQTGSFSLH